MELTVNGEPAEFDGDRISVEQLLDKLDVAERGGIALAVNERVVPRADWGDETLSDGDTVEVIRATQGG